MLSPSLEALPICQYALHVLAVCFFYAGLRQIGVSSWLSVAVSSTLLYSDTILTFGPQVMSDAPASSFAIATIAALLVVAGRPRSALAWVGLMLSLFLTYQTRPAYLFLLPLLPPLGLLLLGLVSPQPKWIHQRKPVFIGLVAACTLPLLAFCTLRWTMVGHFGLVSFGGYNLVGIAGRFLTEDLVRELPEDVRPLARRVLEKRSQLASAQQMSERLEEYGVVIWDIFYPAAVEVYGIQGPGESRTPFFHKGHVLINSKLTKISLALIKARPGLYARQFAQAFRLAAVLTLTSNSVLKLLLKLLLVLLGLWHVLYVWQRLWKTPATSDVKASLSRDYTLELNIMLLIAGSFALGKTLLVILVEVPIPRYTDAAGVFLPAVAVVAVFALWAQIHTLIPTPNRSAGSFSH